MKRDNIIIGVCIVIIVVVLSGLVFMGVNKKNQNKGSKSQTQHTQQDEPKYNFTKPTDEIKNKYEISSEVSLENATTKIVGKVKSNNSETNTIQLVAKIYKENGKLAITSQTVLENVKQNETRDFEIDFSGDYSKNKYIIEVEYIE